MSNKSLKASHDLISKECCTFIVSIYILYRSESLICINCLCLISMRVSNTLSKDFLLEIILSILRKDHEHLWHKYSKRKMLYLPTKWCKKIWCKMDNSCETFLLALATFAKLIRFTKPCVR